MRRLIAFASGIILIAYGVTHAQRYTTSDGRLRVALAKQPFSPTGASSGPNTMADLLDEHVKASFPGLKTRY